MVQKTSLQKINDAYFNGYYTTLVRREVAKKFKLAGFFPRTIVDNKQIIVQDFNKFDEDFDKQTKGRRKKLMTEGASYRKLKTHVVTPSGLALEQYGIEMEVEERDLLANKIQLNTLISEIAKSLAKDIDNNVYEAAKAVATDPTSAYDLTNQWSVKEIEDILADMIKLHNNKEAEGFNFTNVVLGMEALTELQTKMGIQGMEYAFPTNGFTLDNVSKFAGMTFSFGGHSMDAKEFMAFQSDLPALELFYLNYNNPNVQTVPTIPKYEEYTPLINVLKYDNSKTQSEPTHTFQFTTAVGTYAPEEGKRLARIADVMTESND